MNNSNLRVNVCNVKYIHLASVDPSALHVAAEYEMKTARVEHRTYEELHEAVFGACPGGYVCMEPLALFHEVLWSTGIRVTESTGECERVQLERDELHHALEEGEYEKLSWGDETTPINALISICVDVDEALGIKTAPVVTNG